MAPKRLADVVSNAKRVKKIATDAIEGCGTIER
jgi:hypothetical protein